MRIRFLGHACFKLKTKTATVVSDPYSSEVGFAMPQVKADIVTVSHDHFDHNYIEAVKGHPFVVKGPGEYEIKEVALTGLTTFHDNKKGEKRGQNTIYVITAEDLNICHLGDLGHTLKTKTIEQLGEIDVLLVPVGGEFTLDVAKAVELVKQLEPRLVIPMHYRTKKHDADKFAKLKSVADFLQELGVEKKQEEKLSVSKSGLGEEMEVVVLKPNHR